MDARVPRIAVTVSNSNRVNPRCLGFENCRDRRLLFIALELVIELGLAVRDLLFCPVIVSAYGGVPRIVQTVSRCLFNIPAFGFLPYKFYGFQQFYSIMRVER